MLQSQSPVWFVNTAHVTLERTTHKSLALFLTKSRIITPNTAPALDEAPML